MTDYTVVLQYPDYISDKGEHYLAHITAGNVELAARSAKLKACSANGLDPYRLLDDFTTIYVFNGTLMPIS